ncbi:exported hypothetical protein [uncultured Desulfobacterium sp.]|uniref:Bacterial repeat domain-containing protein n=1 Tax=uncultured Desulfobacterium sp. TaxID=201089 RepID=A0A445MW33_9BACT|nr:exported hypothetical protein [uncultured Desulfobacterium sp.]
MSQTKNKIASILVVILFSVAVPFFFPARCLAIDVTLSWNASSGATGYKIYYDGKYSSSGPPYNGTDALDGLSPIDVGNVTQFTLHGLSESGYRFSLTAYNEHGESGYSPQVILSPSQYTLSVRSTGSGAVSPAGGTYTKGASVELRATPASGWVFSGWSGDLNSSTNPATILMDRNKSVTATFTQLTTQYTLSVSVAGQGSVSPAGGNYSNGASVQLRATPASGWVFSGWSGDMSGATNPATVVMDRNKSVTATFTQLANQYTLSVRIAGQGSVSPAGGNYSKGVSVQLMATPASGWVFGGWIGDLNSSTNPATIVINANKTVTAVFMQLQTNYSLRVGITGQGSVRPSGGNYSKGASVQLTATPASGWEFSGWSGDIGGSSNPATIIITSDRYVMAAFRQASPLINVFSATPDSIGRGESATLVWDAVRGVSASIDNGVGAVDPVQGSKEVTPVSTTTYMLTVINAAGSDTKTATVKVGSKIVDVIPHDGAGIQDKLRVSNNTSFAVRIIDSEGIKISDPASIKFSIDDGKSAYKRDLGDKDLVTVTKILDEDDYHVTDLWVAYHRAAETELGNYPFNSVINIEVEIRGNNGQTILTGYEFKTESKRRHNRAKILYFKTRLLPPTDIKIIDVKYNASGLQVVAGRTKGASIIYDSSGPITPVFGPSRELPRLKVEGIKAVGLPINVQPPTTFSTPATLLIPCRRYADVSNLVVFLFNGREWIPACDTQGNVLPGGEGWMVPGSRVNHNDGNPSTIEIKVYHTAGAQAGSATSSGSSY